MDKQSLKKIAERLFRGEKLTITERKTLAESNKYKELFETLGASRTSRFESLLEQVAPVPAGLANIGRKHNYKVSRKFGHLDRVSLEGLVDELEDVFNLDLSNMSLTKFDTIDPMKFRDTVESYTDQNIFDDSTREFVEYALQSSATPKDILRILYASCPS